MKKYFLSFILFSLILAPSVMATEDVIDGHYYDDFEVTTWNGMDAPSVSATNTGRIYYDSTADTLKLSLNGGAYYDMLTTSSGGSLYLKLNQSTAQTITASPIFDWLTASQAVMTDATKKLVSVDYLNQAVKTTSSPTFAGLDITGLTDGYAPYVSASGLANSPIYTDGTYTGINGVSDGANLLRIASTSNDNRNRIDIDDTDTTASKYSGIQFSNGSTFKGGLFRERGTDRVSLWSASSLEILTVLGSLVGIGTLDLDGTPAIGRLTVKGTTNDGSTYAQVWRDSDEVNIATLDTNGNFTALNGGIIKANSAGDDKNVQISQNDTDAVINNSSGNTKLQQNSIDTAITGTGNISDTLSATSTIISRNLINHAKGQIIESITSLIGATYIQGFWIFDETGATTTIADRSGNARNVTLGGNASTLSPSVAGLCPNLAMNGTSATSWSAGDNNAFSFGNGAGVDTAFSLCMLINPVDLSNARTFGKAVSGQYEYSLHFTAGDKIAWNVYSSGGDGTLRQARLYNTALTTDQGSWHTYFGTASGGSPQASSGLKIYRDGVRIDDTDDNAGAYVGMTNGTDTVGSHLATTYAQAKYGIALIISRELTADECRRLDILMRAYSGIDV